MKNDLIAALDIGTSKVACVVARADDAQEIQVLGVGYHLAHGIRGGVIIDLREAAGSILSALHAAEKMSGETIENIMVNISGKPVQSHHFNIESSISGHEVTDKDVQTIIRRGYEQFHGKAVTIMHCIPQNFAIDDITGVRDPRGMCGVSLSTDLHMITATDSAVLNLSKCLASCHVDVQDFVAGSYMSGLSCLSDDEKQLGVVLLDIGAGVSSIAIWSEGNLVYTDQVGIGGMHVTNDIARMLSCPLTFAERIKNLYGAVATSMHDHYDMIEIDRSNGDIDPEMDEFAGVRDDRISKSSLTRIIRPRMEELFDHIRNIVSNSRYGNNSGSRMVLTGGGSQLMGLKELAGEYFQRHMRLGKPQISRDVADVAKSPGFATVIGMVKYAIEKQQQQREQNQRTSLNNTSVLKRAGGWFRRNF